MRGLIRKFLLKTMEYKVSLEKFLGPLDILLSLIEEKKLAISEISLSAVTDQFLEYLRKIEKNISTSDVNNLPTSDVDTSEYQRILADFLVVASRLILIKSRSILPNLVLSEEEDGDIKDLAERLKVYQQIKTLGRELGKWAKERHPYFSREYFLNLPVVFYPSKNLDKEGLLSIYESFLKTLPQLEKLEEQSIARIVTLEEKIEELTGRISAAAEMSFNEISSSSKEKIDIILMFLAIMMLFRKRILEVSQDKLFGEIRVKKSISQ